LLIGCGQPAATPTAEKEPAPLKDSQVRTASAEKPLPPKAAEPTAAEPAPDEPAANPAENAAPSGEPQPLPTAEANQPAIVPVDEIPDAELKMPGVHLSKAHADLCRVVVGQEFPKFEVADDMGQPRALAGLLGKRMTVVAFWNSTRPTACAELHDLGPEILARFGSQGVNVVAINSGDDATRAAEAAQHAQTSLPLLLDIDGKSLAQVVAGRVPCTYLLDADGRVLWFDIEYSRTTRRDLAQAIRFALAGNK
jgi:peroxiredoxin